MPLRREFPRLRPPMPTRTPTRIGRHSTLPLVLVTSAARPEELAPLRKVARVILGPKGGDTMPRAEVLRWAPQVDAIISQGELLVDRELLDHAPRLRIVASASVGVDKLDLSLMAQRGVYATNAPDYFVEATADYTLGAIIALLRRLPAADQYVRVGLWQRFQPGAWDGVLLRGKVLGLIGYGAIGRAVERRAVGFGLSVLHYARTPTNQQGYTPLNQLLARSDIISLHVPLNPDSRELINKERIARMKQGAYLLNVSRGPVVDESALVDALQSGHLGGAALDVFANEPRVSPALRKQKNTVFTPHLGGGTIESRHESRLTCAKNVASVLAGKKPDNLKNRPAAKALSKGR